MRIRILAGALALYAVALCAVAFAQQPLTVNQLVQFIHSSTHDAKAKQTDRDTAMFLTHVRLTERLDDDTIEAMQNDGAGRLTVAALKALADRSTALPAPKTSAMTTNVAPKTMAPPPSSEEQAAIVDSVRDYVLNYSQSLPDFVCKETAETYQAPRQSDRWTKIDTIESKLTYFKQKEDYTPYAMNGKLTSQEYAKLKGSKSIGDFGSMLRGIFEPGTQARFEWKTWSTWDGKPSMSFNYHVAQDRSNYEISAEDHKSVIAGYSGSFVIDAKTHAVVKLTVNAEDMPADFPVKTVQNTLIYRDTELSGHNFLLPSDIEIISDGADFRSKLDKKFNIYRKYSADSEITFDSVDDPAPPPKIKK